MRLKSLILFISTVGLCPLISAAPTCIGLFKSEIQQPPPQVVIEHNYIGECFSCIHDVLQILKRGTLHDIDLSLQFDMAGLKDIKPGQVDLTHAKVLYLSPNDVTTYFHVVLLAKGHIYDPYNIVSSEVSKAIPAKNWFAANSTYRKDKLKWVMEIPALEYKLKQHSYYLHLFNSRFLKDKDFMKSQNTLSKSIQREIKADLEIARKNNDQKRPLLFKDWQQENPF